MFTFSPTVDPWLTIVPAAMTVPAPTGTSAATTARGWIADASVNPAARTASPSERRTSQSPKPKIRCVTARSLSRGSSASPVNSGAPKNRVSGRCGSTSSTKPTNSYSSRNRMMSATTSAWPPAPQIASRCRTGLSSGATKARLDFRCLGGDESDHSTDRGDLLGPDGGAARKAQHPRRHGICHGQILLPDALVRGIGFLPMTTRIEVAAREDVLRPQHLVDLVAANLRDRLVDLEDDVVVIAPLARVVREHPDPGEIGELAFVSRVVAVR